MSTKLRDQSPGPHHVVTRGNNKRTIWEDDRDRTYFCVSVDRVAKKYGWTILAYALMRNHYHLVIVVGDRGLSDGMCELNAGYAVEYNRRHGRVNHLFGKRFFNRYLRTDASVITALRYVVQNPRRAGGTQPLETYVWASYGATVGLEWARMKLDAEGALRYFGRTIERARLEFSLFCAATPLGGHGRWQPP